MRIGEGRFGSPFGRIAGAPRRLWHRYRRDCHRVTALRPQSDTTTRAMARFSLIYRDDGIGPRKRIEFHGEDPGRALQFAHQEAGERSAELWKDGERLCTIRRVGEKPDYWMIGPAG